MRAIYESVVRQWERKLVVPMYVDVDQFGVKS
eukprot:COSAG01_NODE_40836_length_459_cov_0.711111_1_plen_31_part_10